MYQTFLRGTVPRGPFRRGHLCLFIRACSLVRVLGSVFLYAFDLIELNGDDLRREPLETHKATLASLLLPGLRLCPPYELPSSRRRSSLSCTPEIWRARMARRRCVSVTAASAVARPSGRMLEMQLRSA